MSKNLNLLIKLFILCITLCGSIFVSSELFMDAQNTPKQLFGEIGVSLFVLYYACSILLKQGRTKNDKFYFYAILCFSIIAVIEAAYGIAGFVSDFMYHHKVNPVCGSFNNPAGFAVLLSSIYPYFLYLAQVTKGKNRRYIYISVAIIFVAMFMSASRSGILCIISVSLLYILYKKRIAYGKIAIIAMVPICILIYILYTINRNSANGRLFIWTRSFELIKERLIGGYGTGAFKANYMTHQANYFGSNPESAYSMIADNVQYPYNELINLVLEYGLMGLLLFAIFIICVLLCYRKNHTTVKVYAAMSCLSIALFSLFSYPFFYTYTWIIVGFNLYLIVKPSYLKFDSLMEKLHIKYIFAFCVMIFASMLIYTKVQYTHKELSWKAVHKQYMDTRNGDLLLEYQQLYDDMKSNPFFLFNYAVILYNQGKYDESYIIAEQAKSLWKNYEIELLLGDIEDKRNNPTKAIQHYTIASNMCPAKFHPLVQIQQIYKNHGDSISARKYATKIINKPEKVKSQQIKQIKELMKFELRDDR